MDDYISYVEEQIEKWEKHSRLINEENNTISPFLLNKVLGEYQGINLMLISELQRVKKEYFEIQSEFQIWWDEKYLKAKAVLNPLDGPASKWASTKEIESYVRVNEKNEFLIWNKKLFDKEARVSFMRRLMEQWRKFDSILVTISNNMRSEMKALSIFDRSNKTIENVKSGKE